MTGETLTDLTINYKLTKTFPGKFPNQNVNKILMDTSFILYNADFEVHTYLYNIIASYKKKSVS